MAFFSQNSYIALAKDMPLNSEKVNIRSLNIRLSQKPIEIPKNMVTQTVDFPDIQIPQTLITPSPQAAILEDDYRHRVIVLSVLENGKVQAKLLKDLDLQSKIPFVVTCTKERECAYDRRPIMGGLGCMAICIQKAFHSNQQR